MKAALRFLTIVMLAVALAVAVSGGLALSPALAGDPKDDKGKSGGGAAKPAGDPKKDLVRGLDTGDKALVVSALNALATQGGKEVADLIINVALKLDTLAKFSAEASNDIFDAAERALANVKDEEGEKVIFDHLRKHKDVRVRVFLCDVVAQKKSPAAEEALIEAVKDKSTLVEKTAIQHLGLRKSTKAFDSVIEVLGKTEKKRDDPWIDCLRFLTAMTGKDLATAAEWKDWWTVNRATFDPAKVRPGKSTSSGVGETVARGAPNLFGTEILSKKCVFILDVSGSMLIKDPKVEAGKPRGHSVTPKDPGYGDVPPERMRMTRLQEALVKVLEALPTDTHFTIITFGSYAQIWNKELVEANAKNKQDAIDSARGMNPEGFTVTDEALRAAFDVPEANTFYLFSDGIPQRGKNADGTPQRIDTKEILEEVEQLNRVRKVKIFTIGIGEADPNFMRALAGANGGTFRVPED